MDNLIGTASLLLQESKKDDLEYRYKPRVGPILSPEPEFGEFEDLKNVFDIDPDNTLLMTAKANIESVINEFQLRLSTELYKVSYDTYTDLVSSKRSIQPHDFNDLSNNFVNCLKKESNTFSEKNLSPIVLNLLDELMTSMRESLVACKKKTAEKLVSVKDAFAMYKITSETAYKHSKAEVIRITTNEAEDKFKNQFKELTAHAENVDYGNRILTKKVEFFTSEVAKRDVQIHELNSKLSKSLIKVILNIMIFKLCHF
jgi:hypothetical protein